MQKETHAVIGATSALYLTQPTTKEETIVIACRCFRWDVTRL